MGTPIFEENELERLQGHRHHAHGAQLRPVPAVRRPHVPRRGQGAEADALADGRSTTTSRSERERGGRRGRRPDLRAAGRPDRGPPRRAAATARPARLGRRARRSVRLVTELYGAGLERVLELVDEVLGDEPVGRRAVARLLADDLVASLLVAPRAPPRTTWPAGSRPPSTAAGPTWRPTAATSSCSASTRTPAWSACASWAAATAARRRRSRCRLAVERAVRRGGAGDRAHRHRGRRSTRRRPRARSPCPSAASRTGCRRDHAGRRRRSGDPRPHPPGAAPPARPGERCDMCVERDPDDHEHVVNLESREPHVHLPGLLPAVQTDGAGGGRYRAVPDRYRSLADFTMPGRVGRAPDPGERGLLLPQLDARPGGRVLPEPGGRHRVAAAARGLGRIVGGQPGRAARWCPTSRRCWSAARPSRSESFLVPIDACYELVGLLRTSVAGLRRRPGGPRRPSTRFFAGLGLGRSTAVAVSDLAIEVVGARAEPYAAVPTLLFRLRVAEPSGEPVHAVALRAQIRIEPQRRRYSTDEEARLLELFGDPPQWGESLRPFLWTHVGDDAARLHREHRGRPAGALHLRLRGGARPSTCTPWGTARSRWPSCSAAPCSPDGDGGFNVQPVPWHLEAAYRLPVRGVAGADGPLLPEQRLAAAPPRHHRRSWPLQGRAGHAHLGPGASRRC